MRTGGPRTCCITRLPCQAQPVPLPPCSPEPLSRFKARRSGSSEMPGVSATPPWTPPSQKSPFYLCRGEAGPSHFPVLFCFPVGELSGKSSRSPAAPSALGRRAQQGREAARGPAQWRACCAPGQPGTTQLVLQEEQNMKFILTFCLARI